MVESELRQLIHDVVDFPEPGIVFRDITPLLGNPAALRTTVRLLAEPFDGVPDAVVGIEARGFLFGTPVAMALGCAFVPVRKPDKLPRSTTALTYDLEYGTDTLEIHDDGLAPGAKVLIVDDVLATGGTAEAAAKLVEVTGAEVVGVAAVIELNALGARRRLAGRSIHSLLRYD